MTLPSLPAQGAPWLSYAQALDAEIRTGRLSDAELRAALVRDEPSWSTKVGSWDPQLSLYNANPGNLRRWRTALARVESGSGQAHLSTFLDSITAGSGNSAPTHETSWPGRLRALFDKTYGAAGTGIVTPWDNRLPTGSASEPRLTFAGAVTNAGMGIYALGAISIDSNGGAGNYARLAGVTADEVWIYALRNGLRPVVEIVGDSFYTLGIDVNDTGAGASTAFIPAEDGYTDNSAVGSAQLVYRIPVVGGPAAVTVNLFGYPSVYVGVEARLTAGGVRVSNLARDGRSTLDLVLDDPANGLTGMAVALDMARADLAVMVLGMNDFQAHFTVADFKARVRTAIQRQRSAGVNAKGGTLPNGDVLLVTAPQPDYSIIPADHVLTPPLTAYYTALYELADEEDVPLLDIAHRWTDYATSSAFFGDAVHPGDLGAPDIARPIFTALTSA